MATVSAAAREQEPSRLLEEICSRGTKRKADSSPPESASSGRSSRTEEAATTSSAGVVEQIPGLNFDEVEAALAFGLLDSRPLQQVLKRLPGYTLEDLRLSPLSYRVTFEDGGYVITEERFTRKDIEDLHREASPNWPEALTELLKEYLDRRLPPCPPEALRLSRKERVNRFLYEGVDMLD